MRGHGGHHGGHHHRAESGGPGPGFPWGRGFRRRFFTREERLARLEEYLEGLRAEAKAVEERIAAIKAAGQ
ncbi:MAG: hypothetical protein HY687_06115 [Chloroflexi bacterium]|nr:hypothetical protein [Chloroflexota bacterium]